MKNNTTTSNKPLRLKLAAIGMIFLLTGILPAFMWLPINPVTTSISPPPGDVIIPPVPIVPTVAGEPNYSREMFPYILDNYPDFEWKTPGSGMGAGAEQYPAIFAALNGLNESNIRIAYMQADYSWEIVPFQIDHRGWANTWQLADMNKWAGLDVPTQGRTGNDAVEGIGNINGDPACSNGDSYPAVNDLLPTWYRVPTWTYITPYLPDGSVNSEQVNIDPEYRDDLVWIYNNDAQRPHDSWPATAYAGDASEAWIRTTGGAPTAGPSGNVIFMGDTWFKTPCNNPAIMPDAGVRAAFPYEQIDGALDNDDELVFYAYPGRQAPSYVWWNFAEFPKRFELEIIDPIDNGRCWMYIYYNDLPAYDPDTGINLGAPTYTTETTDYCSWDPDTRTITSDFYQLSTDESNPSLLDYARMFGETDGQQILTSFNKMYGFGHVEDDVMGIISEDLSAGREGIWYQYSDGAAVSFSEMICTLDNPSVLYPTIADDLGYLRTYGSEQTADKSRYTSPSQYVGPQGVVRGAGTGVSIENWEQYGDGRAIIDGPCRVIMYLQQYLVTGVHAVGCASSVGVDDYVDIYTSMLDGCQYYYSRMQLSPPATIAMPAMAGLIIEIYYIYMMCATLASPIRGDFNLSGGMEWSGTTDGTDDGEPTFDFTDGYGYTKIGGLDPMTTGYTLIPSSIPDGNGGSGDYFTSGGDPLRNVYDNTAPDASVPPGANPLPDWIMLTSETHGGMFIYIPRREVMEIRDNGGNDGYAAVNAQIKMYFRDDSYRGEFGICCDAGADPWIPGGASTSPYSFMMVYGDFNDADVATWGHKLYLSYFFPLTGITTFTPQTLPPQFIFGDVTPDKLVYNIGDTVTIDVYGSTQNATITCDFDDIEVADPTADMTNLTGGYYTITYTIDALDAPATNYERDINLTATVPTWASSVYTLTITIDTVAPSPTAQLDPLPGTTTEASVMLDWGANTGYDEGTASMANPDGIGHYRIRRGTSTGVYDTIVADYIPITTTQFADSFVINGATYYYVLDTYDEVGNMATGTERSTLVNLPFTPAQPDDLPPTTDGNILIDWTANPGYIDGGSIDNYRVYRSSAFVLEDALGGTFVDQTGNLAPTTYTWTDTGPFTEAYYYCYKVESRDALANVLSSAVYTRADTVDPAPAELATPYDPYQSQTESIIVSWAVETIPQYASGGFPGHDMNGVDHWDLYKDSGGGLNYFATIPYGPLTADQQYLDTNVVDTGTYTYEIRTYDGAGNMATGTYQKTTTLNVVGQGKAEAFSVTAGTSEVTQGDTSIPITVNIWNPGATAVTLTDVSLKFWDGAIDVTSEYTYTPWSGSTGIPALWGPLPAGDIAFTVDVGQSATLGDITITAETGYTESATPYTCTDTITPDSWTVKPDADLVAQSVSSTVSVVHPGEEDIPVDVVVFNPGGTNAIVESVQLVFTQGITDISDKFMVEYITSVPTTGFTGSRTINMKVTVSQSVTTGNVEIDAIVSGSALGISLSDDDGADTTKSWAISTWPIPVVADVVADMEVYWAPDEVVLTITCDANNIPNVEVDYSAIDSGMTWENFDTNNGDGTYINRHTLVNTLAIGEGTHSLHVRARNTSGSSSFYIDIRLGQAPYLTGPGLSQFPLDGAVNENDTVDIDVDLDDLDGAANVVATLYYRVGGANWVMSGMTYAGGTHHDGTIPGQAGDSVVDYYVNATDALGNWATFADSYTVNSGGVPPPPEPDFVPGSESVHDPADPGTTYNLTSPAPRDQDVAHTVTVDGTALVAPTLYVVLVTAFDPVRDCFLLINGSVLVPDGGTIDVTLDLYFDSGIVGPGTLITGTIYIMTDLPSNLGRTITWISFSYLVN